eukprot:bmy_17002T0
MSYGKQKREVPKAPLTVNWTLIPVSALSNTLVKITIEKNFIYGFIDTLVTITIEKISPLAKGKHLLFLMIPDFLSDPGTCEWKISEQLHSIYTEMITMDFLVSPTEYNKDGDFVILTHHVHHLIFHPSYTSHLSPNQELAEDGYYGVLSYTSHDRNHYPGHQYAECSW